MKGPGWPALVRERVDLRRNMQITRGLPHVLLYHPCLRRATQKGDIHVNSDREEQEIGYLAVLPLRSTNAHVFRTCI